MFENTFKNIDDILHKDAGCGSELDYVEQTSWVLFLKYLNDLEKDKETAARLKGKTYNPLVKPEFRWDKWASPKTKDGKLDHHKALTGDDLKDFVDLKLFPYLRKFKHEAEHADTLDYKIGEIFSELKNKLQSGYNLREVINRVDELRFRTHAEKHEMSHLYEDKIKNMGNAGRNGGEYYTPRPLIRTIIKVVKPEIGDKIYDGAAGSAGFLVEAFDYLRSGKNLTTKDIDTLQRKTFYGKEKKSLAYIIGTMNMILRGWRRRISFTPIPSARTSTTFRKKTVTISSWPTHLSVARKEQKYNRTSPSRLVKPPSSFFNTSLKSSGPVVKRVS
ncbi:MAG TPA: N-6 DNA methylase [Chitinophagaceae bacterium]